MDSDHVYEVGDEVRHRDAGAVRKDPTIVLNAARVAAEVDCGLAPDTEALFSRVADNLNSISPTIAGRELIASLENADSPRRYFDILHEVGVLDVAYPEVAALDDLPAGPEGTHEEGDTLEHTLQVVEAMHDLRGNDVKALLAALGHDLGKAATPDDIRPSHHGHAKRGAEIAADMHARLELPLDYEGAMAVGARQHMRLHQIEELNATTVLDMAKHVRRSPLTPEQVVAVGEADSIGREPARQYHGSEANAKLTNAVDVLETVDEADALARRGMSRETTDEDKIRNILRQDRAEAYRERAHSAAADD